MASAEGRTGVLQALQALVCQWQQPMDVDAFVQARGVLLNQLAALQEPWSSAERILFAQALKDTEQLLRHMADEKQVIARKLRALRYAKTAARGPYAAARTVRRTI